MRAGWGVKSAVCGFHMYCEALEWVPLGRSNRKVCAMGHGRRETGLLGRLFNYLTQSGTTVTRTRDFWGNKKTVVHNYDTGTTKEYKHGQGFFGDRTDVKVYRDGRRVGKGSIKKDVWGHDVEKLEFEHGRVKKSVKTMNCGLFGNCDKIEHYGEDGESVGSWRGRRGVILPGYSRSYSGICFRCNGTGVFHKTGDTCRKCGGTGVSEKWLKVRRMR